MPTFLATHPAFENDAEKTRDSWLSVDQINS
jgi:hypothetical protein